MPSGRPKLLLADDSPTIRKIVSLTFGDEGFEVVAVGDGVEALRALAEEPPPDVLLADTVMPGPDGYELCERVKRDGRLARVPVVLLVGAFEPFNKAEARRVGADTFLTKPFQSIRDLVSKVGSLLGGGESREEDEAARAHDADARVAPEPAAEPAARAEARPAAAPFAGDEARAPQPESSFADLGADDELIEARPADAFGAAASASGFQARAERAGAFAAEPEADFDAGRRADLDDRAEAEPPDADVLGAEIFAGRGEGDEEDAASLAEPDLLEQTEERPMRETTSPQPSFDARAEGATAADDALLDLGLVDAPPAAAAAAPPAESDDFILDLDDLDLGDGPHAPRAAAGVPDEPAADVLDEPAFASATPASRAWADAPSAFAEAAHGEPVAPTTPAAHAEPARAFEMSAATSEASAPAAVEDAPWRDVVLQDGPQGFAFGGEEPQALGTPAPRGFIEPEVVPADEPVPATVEGEFTDGSVEGDVPRPPAGAPAGSAAGARDAGATPREASAAGFAVGEARAGVEESPRAEPLSPGRLSPEDVDAVARRVVELMSDKVVREIAWEVVPELAELLVKQRLDEERRG
ncbi:MAG TPA: response regulator [Pyrinomonadaceae bacterium]